ncbi:hypothetical protein DL769_007434 [Monosporascus sp. CRB-8-3]|nr:hypothetical protein DL769_007434 [Monosporascus sp. CRB-8-3]
MAVSYGQLVWREASPGLWAGSHSREDVERRIEDAVRKGWVALRHDRPTIASLAAQDRGTGKFSKIYRRSKTDAQRDRWLENTVKVVSTGQTGMEWANPDPPVPDLPTLFIIRPPPSSTVVRDIQERPPTTSRVRYVNCIAKNERASCVEPYNTSKHAVAAYHSVSDKSLTVDMAWPGAGDSDASQESDRK